MIKVLRKKSTSILNKLKSPSKLILTFALNYVAVLSVIGFSPSLLASDYAARIQECALDPNQAVCVGLILLERMDFKQVSCRCLEKPYSENDSDYELQTNANGSTEWNTIQTFEGSGSAPDLRYCQAAIEVNSACRK